MKITVTGTSEELKAAKEIIDGDCFFNDKCPDLSCEECEREHNF